MATLRGAFASKTLDITRYCGIHLIGKLSLPPPPPLHLFGGGLGRSFALEVHLFSRANRILSNPTVILFTNTAQRDLFGASEQTSRV